MAPFSDHLREAIALNRARLEPWAVLSQGRTRVVSRLLITSEYATLPVAWWTERQARRAAPSGLRDLDRCFVSMRDLPPVERAAPADAPQALRRARAAATTTWARAVAAARRADAPDAALAASLALLRDLADAPGALCMRRHLAESAARAGSVLMGLSRESAVRPVLWGLLQRHGLGFGAADRLDDLALPLQREGVPILAHDLPVIPWQVGSGVT